MAHYMLLSRISLPLQVPLSAGAMASVLASFVRAASSLLVGQFEAQLQSLRFRSMKASRRIRGYPRPLLKGIVRPEPMKYGFRPILPEDGVYTTEKLPIRKLAGRHPETGEQAPHGTPR